MFWFQKSNEKWVKIGDRNTSFFHAQTIVHRKRNKVAGLFLADGSWCVDQEQLKNEALSFISICFALLLWLISISLLIWNFPSLVMMMFFC